MHASKAAVKRSESENKKTTGIRRNMMRAIVRHLLKTNNHAGSFKDRCVLIILISAVGRSGEASTTNWKFPHWCNEAKTLIMERPEVKPGFSTVFSIGHDANSCELYVIDSLACYLKPMKEFSIP